MNTQYSYKVQFHQDGEELLASMRVVCNNSPYVVITRYSVSEEKKLLLEFDLIQSEMSLARSIDFADVQWRLPGTIQYESYSVIRQELQPTSSELEALRELGEPYFRGYGEPAETVDKD